MKFFKRFIKCPAFWLMAIAGLATNSQANVIHVPGDQQTIQAGLDAASSGDTVLVAAGTYYENILWPELNGIRLFGAGMNACIIDGSNQGSVMRFDSIDIIDTLTAVRGFTLTNGNALPPWPESQGGGVYIFAANPILEELNITGNTADDFGGGIYIWGGAAPIIRYCLVTDNTAASNGGLHCLGAEPILDHVTFSGNNPGGLYFDTRGYPLIENSIVAFNFDYGVRLQGTSFGTTTIGIAYSDTRDAVQEIGYSNVDWLGVNIDADPLFVDRDTGDFHLMSDSPCIDAGDPEYEYDPDGTITDMGPFYFEQATGISEYSQLPIALSLQQNYPNPFNARTTIKYALPHSSFVNLDIFDLLGRKVTTLVSTNQPAGYHQVTWDAAGKSSGMYFYRIQAAGRSESGKMLLLK